MKNLILICGGQSPEHEISLRSAKNVLASLDRDKFNVKVIGIAKSGKWYLKDEKSLGTEVEEESSIVTIEPGKKSCFIAAGSSIGSVDVVLPLLHGPNGEDGSVQGLLQLLGLPFVGTGILGSAVSMDKDVAKRLLRAAGIKVANWTLLRSGEKIPAFEVISEELGQTVFVKPANMGSSVGVSRVTCGSGWEDAVAEALSMDEKVLIEEQLEGRELECAVLGNQDPIASGIGEVKSGDIYSYDEKYAETSVAQVIIPAEVGDDAAATLRETALSAYKTLECKGLSRVDMFLTNGGEVYVNEVNTMPGFTSISMYPKLWEQEGISYKELLTKLIELALERG